ncbi:TonB-dependent receptor [Flavobacterium sp. MFBS3-15]|uniref:SusC/RagA family TonB-linked outer membrane protein n=1 Tax=Flavobacterium sp. MFBS3-15 TaxID=2989816 RepID=UPI0022355A52|nr:TonB-dependent receptor [Flavobacterium sp. MFBS3-15]MCW4467384.1 TonB-dependent receptor [Flavobacterium sp. MFBS3-15]
MKSKFTWIFTLLLAFFIQFSFAQERTVTGVVVDNTGMPIPSATVKVQGSSAPGVQTDFDGNYSIQAKPGDKVEISYVGMQTQVVTVSASGTVPNVTLTDDPTVLDNVVVEGYRNSTKPLSNIAVTTVTAKTIEGRPNASFIQTLQGQIPGLNISTGSGQPGANSTVILRGYGSINGKVEPLFVIDGVPLDADNFRSLNPNDIESVSVLKDAGATSIYGNRGANGVIIVKTKKGTFDSPLQVKYTGITSFTEMQSNKYNVMNSRQLLGLEKTAQRGYGASLTDEEIAAYDINTNWKDVLFRTGTSQNHVLSLTGGGKNLSAYTSVGFFDQEGILIDTRLKRFNFRNNLTGRSNDGRFNYSTALTVNYSRRDEASNIGTGNVNINPVLGANQGVPYISPDWYTTSQALVDMYRADATDPNNIGAGSLLLSPLMQLDIMKKGTLQTEELKMIGNVQASYRLTDELTAGTTFGADYTQATGLQVQDPTSFNSLFFAQAGEEYLGWQFESFARNVLFNTNVNLNFTKSWGDHTLDASAFTEYFKGHSKSFNYAQNGLDPKVFVPGNGAGFIPFDPGTPTFYLPEVASGKGTAGLFSYFASADYDYKEKYGLSATIRRDASYRFAETNRWGTYWSVSGRWNIDRESFMEGSVFQMLKLRASYGTTGNQNIFGESIFNAPNGARTLFAQGTGYANQPAYILGQLGNPDLQWETVAQANIGVDFEVFNRRLRGTFDVYRRTTDDLYQEAQLSAITGTYEILANGGSLQNQGVEALLAYDVIKSNDFMLTLNFNGSYNQNKLLDITTVNNFRDLGLTARDEGGSLGQFYLIKYAGVNPANGNLLFYTKDGQLTENPDQLDDRRLTGKTSIPTYQGGFGFDASYKGFFLTTQFSFVADIYRFDYDLEGLQDPTDIGTWNKTTDLLNAWTPDNRVTDIPSLTLTNKGMDANSDRYLKDASYVRLRYMSLGYSFSNKLLEKTPFTGLRAYFQAENLVTWTKWRGWDAESNRGADQYQYPTPRILSLGLEVQF